MVAGPLESVASTLSGHRVRLWLMIANEAPWHLRADSTHRIKMGGVPLSAQIHKFSV